MHELCEICDQTCCDCKTSLDFNQTKCTNRNNFHPFPNHNDPTHGCPCENSLNSSVLEISDMKFMGRQVQINSEYLDQSGNFTAPSENINENPK